MRIDPTGTCFKLLGIVLIDCQQSTCPDSRYFNAKRIAVIYDSRQSGILRGRLFGKGFKHQGEELVKRLEKNNYVESHPIKNATEFVDAWNSLSGEYDKIYIICHAEYGNLYFRHGAVSVEGKKYQYSDLNAVDVKEMFLYCCNGATISETGGSVAISFHEITGARIYAIQDGKIGFTWAECYPYATEDGVWIIYPD